VLRETWPVEFPERARELHKSGLTCQETADQLGVPFATAKSWIWPAGHGRYKQKRREAAA
jgi:orotate phosphoribosyltransferase-like protein